MDGIGVGLTSRQSASSDCSPCPALENGRGEHLIALPTLAQTEALRDDGSPQPAVSPSTQKKKKKKKKKSKKASTKDGSSSATVQPQVDNLTDAERPPVLCISRNKHWKYISSYHGPWLQLPLELLESLLVLNLDPGTMSPSEGQFLSSQPTQNGCTPKRPCFRSPPRLDEFDRGFRSLSDYTPPESPGSTFTSLSPLQTLHPPPPAFPLSVAGRPTPPPIDPGVFRNVAAIRRLIDEAAELSVRASSGLSAAALGSMRNGGGNASRATAHALGLDGTGNVCGGRNVAMSAMRIHRLRALAVQKLAAAYKADEVASSVMVMQGGSVFDDIAERVLKHDPNDPDARYVHFFHEKIPSRANRQLAESTTTQVLDELIAAYPQRLEYYRTRGIVHCFRDEYMLAIKDFTHALKEARIVRKGRTAHRTVASPTEPRGKLSKQKKSSNKSHGRAPPNGTSASTDTFSIDGVEPLLHSSVLPDAPDPIEPQLLFLRGAAYLQQTVYLIESAILKLEGVSRSISAVDGAELRLCYLANGRYGGVEVGNPDGPLGKSDGPKARAYRQVLADAALRNEIDSHLRKCVRDHERFLSHFDTIEGPSPVPTTDSPAELARRVELAFRLTEIVRSGNHSAASRPPVADSAFPLPFTTYHPLIVESHFNILICQLMLGELATLVTTFARTAVIVEGLEGYPVFLPPRSMAQAEFIEVLERLAAGWRVGVLPHSATQADSLRSRAEIEAPLRSLPLCLVEEMSFNAEDDDPSSPVASSSTKGIVTPSPRSSERDTPTPCSFREGRRIDLVEALECARMLLATVARRQKERTSKAAADKTSNGNKKPLNINIPLHGPRVEIILAWFAAVHLVDLESVA